MIIIFMIFFNVINVKGITIFRISKVFLNQRNSYSAMLDFKVGIFSIYIYIYRLVNKKARKKVLV